MAKAKLLLETDGVLLPVHRVKPGDTLVVQVDDQAAVQQVIDQLPAALRGQVSVLAANGAVKIAVQAKVAEVTEEDPKPSRAPERAPRRGRLTG